jgi:pyruvate/2-oxoglutarate dehydrogenase complex dihydrolipoamide dehydrogenase (E3) component
VVIGGGVGIDMRQVKARKDAIVAASRNGLTSALENAANITLYRGHAQFASPQAVEIAPDHHNTGQLRAQRIFINVGGRALVPPMPGISKVRYLTNSSSPGKSCLNASQCNTSYPPVFGAQLDYASRG